MQVSGRENAAVFDPGQALLQRQELCYFMPLPRVAEISEVKPPTPSVLKSGELRRFSSWARNSLAHTLSAASQEHHSLPGHPKTAGPL
jgi:hypothetical protein